tara:strand:- start:27 stop:413 length:387 start_codon:yes stop_codon:yes gene_type:complete
MLSRLRKLKDDKGFTLIELLIVIAIIGILAAIAIPQFSAYKQRIYNSDTQAILHKLYLSCKAYWADNGKSSACATSDITSTTYGFTSSPEMTLTIGTGTEKDFAATAKNINVPGVTYSIDSAGTIIKK